jgi:hypothetical protein
LAGLAASRPRGHALLDLGFDALLFGLLTLPALEWARRRFVRAAPQGGGLG